MSLSFSGGTEVSFEEFPEAQRGVGAGQELKGDVRRSAGTKWLPRVTAYLYRCFLASVTRDTSVLQRSAFFTVQLSHPYMTTGNQHCTKSNTIDLVNISFGPSSSNPTSFSRDIYSTWLGIYS